MNGKSIMGKAGVAYVALIVADFIASNGQKINSQKELEIIVGKEAEELNMDPEGVNCELLPGSYPEAKLVEGMAPGRISIILGGSRANTTVVRGLLYDRIYGLNMNGSESLPNWAATQVYNWLFHRPSSILYAHTGLKL